MKLRFGAVFVCALLALAVAYTAADQVVYQEDFSQPFVERDWVYNNSSNNDTQGYPGLQPTQPWPAKISNDGHELLGYSPNVNYYTSFEPTQYAVNTSISGVEGWVGAGTIVTGGHGHAQCVRFVNQNARRNVGGSSRAIHYVQCYARCSETNATAFIHVGTNAMMNVAAMVRFNSDGHIEALNGDGSGGGTWAPVAVYARDKWYRITLKIDYSLNVYNVAVQGAYNAADFDFVELTADTLGAVQFVQPDGACVFSIDDLGVGDTPYLHGDNGREYWSDGFNHWCVRYDDPIDATRDAYDWMSCTDLLGNPVNTDPTRALAHKASLPTDWTAAFGAWADIEPNGYWSSGRGKMGFTRLMGAYAQSPANPCLHAWSTHGDMRIASPNITTGPGVYTASFKAGVWNCNTADPAKQYKWSDFCSWGYGYTNWCAWDEWNPLLLSPTGQPYRQTIPPYPMSLNGMGVTELWTWPDAPFHQVDPDGTIDDRPDGPHPTGEEPGMWHSYTTQFAFGSKPEKDGAAYNYQSDPGFFFGFRVSHGHDPHNAGYRWATILNVDDIVLTKKDPVTAGFAKNAPVGTLVEVDNLVITNMIPSDVNTRPYVDIYVEKLDRSAGFLVRSGDMTLYSDYAFDYQIGDVVRVVGAVCGDPSGIKYIGDPNGWSYQRRLPAVVKTQTAPAVVDPVAINQKSLIGQPVTAGVPNDGMLVTVAGKVNNVLSSQAPAWYFVDDGSALNAGKPYWGANVDATGVRIDCSVLALDGEWSVADIPSDGDYVAVTGVLTAELHWDGNTVVRVLYPRDHNDIKVY